jgi:hypothetical protein
MNNDNEPTLEELTTILEKESEKSTPIKAYKSGENKDVLKFIRKTGLQAGDNKVPTYVIYYHFILWCRHFWIHLWKKQEFFRTFSKHFQIRRSGHQRYYMINDSLDLSKEFYEKAKKYDNKYKKRVKQKRKKQVSSTTEGSES